MKKRNSAGYAFFDLDFTVLHHDTMLLFCNYILQKEPWRIFFLFIFLPVLPLAAFKLIRSKNLKRIFFSFLWRMPLAKLSEYTKDFVDTVVIPEVHPELLAEIKRHKKENRITVLNTASPDIYPAYIAKQLGFDTYRATQFILSDPLPLFIPVKGPNNKRAAKLFSMKEILPEKIQRGLERSEFKYEVPGKDPVIKNSWAYSDSPADLPMLLLSENPVLINPVSGRLINIQKNYSWKVLRPGKCKKHLCTYFRMIRQLLGLYKSS